MHKLSTFVAAVSFTLVTGFACGGEDEKDDGFSLPDSTVLGTLTDAQSQTLCTETKAYLSSSGLEQDFHEISCRFAGLTAAGQAAMGGQLGDQALQDACQNAFEVCAVGNTPIGCATFTPSCMATVGDYKACLTEADAVSAEGLMMLPACDQVTLVKLLSLLQAGEGAIPPTPACDAFEAKCPDVDIPIPELP
jgi:hypothetical protein